MNDINVTLFFSELTKENNQHINLILYYVLKYQPIIIDSIKNLFLHFSKSF